VLASCATTGVPGPFTAFGGRFCARSKSLERRGEDIRLLGNAALEVDGRDPDAVG
jgi:hypothetical protein